MGILTRKKDTNWIIELREKWYCSTEKEAAEVQSSLLRMRCAFEVAIEEHGDAEYYTLNMHNKTIKPKSFADCLLIYKELMDFKKKYGQTPLQTLFEDVEED